MKYVPDVILVLGERRSGKSTFTSSMSGRYGHKVILTQAIMDNPVKPFACDIPDLLRGDTVVLCFDILSLPTPEFVKVLCGYALQNYTGQIKEIVMMCYVPEDVNISKELMEVVHRAYRCVVRENQYRVIVLKMPPLIK